MLRQTTGQREQPRVQQQQIQPQNNHLMLTGSALRNTLLMRFMVARNSSGATWKEHKKCYLCKLVIFLLLKYNHTFIKFMLLGETANNVWYCETLYKLREATGLKRPRCPRKVPKIRTKCIKHFNLGYIECYTKVHSNATKFEH